MLKIVNETKHSLSYKYPTTPENKNSYKILNPKAVEDLKDSKEPKKIAQVILDAVALDAENYRLGNTKAWKPSKFILRVSFLRTVCASHFLIDIHFKVT